MAVTALASIGCSKSIRINHDVDSGPAIDGPAGICCPVSGPAEGCRYEYTGTSGGWAASMSECSPIGSDGPRVRLVNDSHGCPVLEDISGTCCGCVDGGPAPDAGPRSCGGLGGAACLLTEYCDWTPDSCGAADQTGICTPRPEACPQIYAPVCACDGMTYPNECTAQASGQDMMYPGPCGSTPPVSCDRRNIRCNIAPPPCPSNTVPTVGPDGCWGMCVPVDSCACSSPAECPTNACNLSTGRCMFPNVP